MSRACPKPAAAVFLQPDDVEGVILEKLEREGVII
jgi:hypothetical protein